MSAENAKRVEAEQAEGPARQRPDIIVYDVNGATLLVDRLSGNTRIVHPMPFVHESPVEDAIERMRAFASALDSAMRRMREARQPRGASSDHCGHGISLMCPCRGCQAGGFLPGKARQ